MGYFDVIAAADEFVIYDDVTAYAALTAAWTVRRAG